MPVFDIFKRCYVSKTSGLVLSVCRDLFEQIFRKSLGVAKNPQPNCYHDQRFVDYLTVQHAPSKEVLFDDQYAEIFKKYNLKRPDYHEFFLDNVKAPSRDENSFSQPSSICSDICLDAGNRFTKLLDSKKSDNTDESPAKQRNRDAVMRSGDDLFWMSSS